MAKILLSNTNTVWGVISNPQSSNSYRQVLSFDSQQLKDDFINKYLFGGGDYKALLDKRPHSNAFTQLTSLKAVFTVQPADYPNETWDSLLNKDFVIIQERDEIRFYTMSGERTGQVIKYTAELDVFFTVDIKDMFNDNPVRITRAMTDRFVPTDYQYPTTDINNITVSPIIYKKNYDYLSPLYNSENFDNFNKNIMIPASKTKNFEYYYSSHYYPADHQHHTSEKNRINEVLNGLVWEVVEFNDSFSGESVSVFNKTKLPYTTILIPRLGKKEDKDKTRVIFQIMNGSTIVKSIDINFTNYTNLYESAKLIKNTRTVTGISPLPNNFHNAVQKDLEITYTVNSVGYEEIHISIQVGWRSEFKIPNLGYSTYVDDNVGLDYSHNANNDINVLTIREYQKPEESVKYEIPQFTLFHNISILNKNQIVENSHKFEIKSNFSPYQNIELKIASNNKFIASPQYFTQNRVEAKMGNGYMGEVNGSWVELQNYNNLYLDNDFRESRMLIEYTNYSLPTDSVAWNEFIVRNKASQTAGWINKGISAGVGIGTALASGGLTAVAGLSLAGQSSMGILNQLAQRADIKNSPDTIVNNGSTLNMEQFIKGLHPKITRYSLEPQDLLIIKEHFYKYGYNFANKLVNINDLLKSRYYFNYIESNETFENIKAQLSGEIKQLINDTLAEGVTIWHIRDLTEFKGIKNYRYENIEMSLLKAVKSD